MRKQLYCKYSTSTVRVKIVRNRSRQHSTGLDKNVQYLQYHLYSLYLCYQYHDYYHHCCSILDKNVQSYQIHHNSDNKNHNNINTDSDYSDDIVRTFLSSPVLCYLDLLRTIFTRTVLTVWLLSNISHCFINIYSSDKKIL